MGDPYRAGKCPECGEYANGTQRHPGAPVFCKNGHSWQRPTIDKLQKEIAELKQRWEDLKGYMKQEAADEGQRGSDYSAYFSHVAKKMEKMIKEKK